MPSHHLALVALLLGAAPAATLADTSSISQGGPLRLELPLVDGPYNFAHGYRAPSMAQAQWIARDLTTTLDWGIALGAERFCQGRPCEGGPIPGLIAVPVTILTSALTMGLPGFGGWSHEEFHRTVMGQYGIDSSNDMNRIQFGAEIVNVSHVTDADLIRLKKDHNPDLVRLSAAGMESDIELARALDAGAFFDGGRWTRDLAASLLTRYNVISYMWACDGRKGMRKTDENNAKEGADVAKRDFTGLDCVAWAYDVQRPDEPYEARGTHPSGVGINRYRKPTDMTPQERKLLTQAKWLALGNLVSPAMFGLSWGVPGAPDDWRMTGGLAHQMSSFGQALTVDLYLRSPESAWRGAVRSYLSKNLVLPGLELERVRMRTALAGLPLEVTPTVGLWLQPAHDRWDDKGAKVGGLARLRVAWLATERLYTYVEGQAKTAGWQPGTVELGDGVEGRVGVGGLL